MGFYDFWQKKLHGFKNCISRVHKIFLRKICFNKKPNTWFFWTFSGKLFKVPWSFFRPSVNMQSMLPAEPFGGIHEVWDNFWQSLTQILSMSVFFAFYVSRGTFEEENASINYFSPAFFLSRKLFRFLGNFFSAGLPNMQSMWLEKFCNGAFFWENWSFIWLFSEIVRKAYGFLSSFLAALLKLQSTCAEDHTEEKPSFQKEKSALFSDFDPQKNNSEKKTRNVRKNCPYLVKRTFGATFFQNVISGIIIFRSSAKYFLPPLERVWHGCENGILRDQSTVKGAYCFKVHKLKLFNNFMPRAEEHETIGLIFWHDFQICIFFDQIKNGLKILFFICFRTLSVVFFGFWWTIFGESCQNCKSCLQRSFFKRW